MKKRSRKLAASISVRLDYDLISDIDKLVEEGIYDNRTHAITELLNAGFHLRSLIAISKDPEKKQELHSKFMSILDAEDIETKMETMNIDTLKLIRTISNEKIEKKFMQLVIEVKKGK